MISLYFYAFLVLCIVAGSAVGLYFISDSYIKIKDEKSLSSIEVCPPGVNRADCLKYEDVISSEEQEEDKQLSTPTFPTGLEDKRINKLSDDVKDENDYIMNLNKKIDEINEKLI